MAIQRLCELRSRTYDTPCYLQARYFVHWFTDGNGGKSTCAKHLTRAIAEVQAATNGGFERDFKVRLLY